MRIEQTDSSGLDTVGRRIRKFRDDKGLTLTELAQRANVSKGYLSTLETSQTKSRPSGATLYAVAEALGVTMSDLLGRRLLTEPATDTPDSLLQFAEEDGLTESDVRMLAAIRFRGGPPQTVSRWRYIYQAIMTSENLDNQVR